MSFLKAVTIVTLWLVLSFFWVSMGQSQTNESECQPVNLESLIAPHPVLSDWYHFCLERKACEPNAKDLFRIISSNETLSTKLNQANVRFDQIYSPLARLIESDLECLPSDGLQNVQSDLTSIEDSLRKVLTHLSAADGDYLRAVVVLSQASDFVKVPPRQDEEVQSISRRLNRPKYHFEVDRPIHFKEVVPAPFEEVFSLSRR